MTEKKSIRLAGKVLEHSAHVCAFFNTRDEKYQVLFPFIDEGDKAFHTVNPQYKQDHLRRLKRVHPVVIIEGVLYEDLFYTPPENFLLELDQRASSSG
ncbi:MAG TPA: hypothetical protein VK206_08250 [Anaerolineales bacterium]|nr:hypothetical protein [Anaerolineales bacterium]